MLQQKIERKTRDSNFEALRVISMFMVIILHIGTHGIQKHVEVQSFLDEKTLYLYYFIRSLSIIAVSLYVLISGYFLSTSKFKIVKLTRLFLETSLFSSVIYVLNVMTGYADFSRADFVSSLVSIIMGEYWFVSTYFVLFAVSPYLNKLIGHLSKKEHLRLLLLLFIFCNIWQFLYQKNFSGVFGGYSLVYFVFLYFLAAFIRKYNTISKGLKRNLYLFIYMALAMLNSVLVTHNVSIGNVDSWFAYNSPIVLAMSYCLFQYFRTLTFKSISINFTATYVFGIYLIHEQPIFKKVLWHKLGIIEDITSSSGLGVIIHMFLYAIAIFACCWILSYIISSTFNYVFTKVVHKSAT